MSSYLDESFLSNIVKQQQGADLPHYADLYRVLSRLVDEDKVVCPRSTVHDQEAGFDSRLTGPIHRVLSELSGGARFRVYREIEYDQTVRALHRYLGLAAEDERQWHQAFYRDPHPPLARPRIHVRIPDPPWFVSDDRKRRFRMHEFSKAQSAILQAQPRRSRAELRAGTLQGVVHHVYVRGLLDPTAPPYGWRLLHEYAHRAGKTGRAGRWLVRAISTSYLVPLMFARGLFLRAVAFRVAPRWTDERYWGFFLSPHFDGVPYYDIFCSLAAGFNYQQVTRTPARGDAYDFAALASVTPYVDIVTTDRAMKGMLTNLGVAKKWGVVVYSPGAKDVKELTARLEQIS